jgi:predicted ATP-grasp superfamily ATP-dependent carboligase
MGCKILLSTTAGWTSVARLAHGFAAASCVVEAHAPADAPVLASRYVSAQHCYRPLSPIASLRSAIVEGKPDLLVACDDRAVAHMLKLYNDSKSRDPDVAAIIERSLGAPASYLEMMSRSGFMARAKSLGIRVPDTRHISSGAELTSCIAETGLPIVLKADGSWGGDGVVVARSGPEALAAFHRLGQPPSRLRSLARAMRRRDAHHLNAAISPAAAAVSAQRFVPGRPAASAFACWNGEVIAAIYYDVLVAEGETGPPNVIRRVDCPEMEAATRKIAAYYRLSGIQGMDFLRDASGAVHLIEINPRATQGGALAFGPGRDLPAALASRLQPLTGMRAPILNDTVAIFPREWQRDPVSPWLLSAHHDVPWDDPAVLLASLRGTSPLKEPALLQAAGEPVAA